MLFFALLASACDDKTLTQTVPVTHTNTVTTTVTNTVLDPVTNTVTNTVTITDPTTITVVDDDLDGGQFEAPLVELVELIGSGGTLPVGGVAGATHMHTSELLYRPESLDHPAQLFDCSYTLAVYNATNPASASIMAQGWTHTHVDVDLDGDGVITKGIDVVHSGTRKPGCTHLTFDETESDIVFTSHHGNNSDGDSFISGFDLNTVATVDPVTGVTSYKVYPTQLPMFYEDGSSFEGMDFEGGLLYATLHGAGLGIYQRDPVGGTLARVGGFTGLQNAFDVLVSGTTAYVADGQHGLAILDVTDPAAVVQLAALEVPGTGLDLALNGTTLYVAAESGGLVIVDVSDPSAPTIANTLTNAGTTLGLSYADDRLFVAAWTDARVFDVTDPVAPRWIGAVRREVSKDFGTDDGLRPDINNRVLTVAGSGDTLFDGTWWTPYNYQVHAGRTAPYMVLPEDIQQVLFPGDLELGESVDYTFDVQNDGNEPLTVTDIWSDSPAFTVTPNQVRVEPGERATVTVTFRPTIGITQAQLDDPAFDRSLAEEAGQLFIVSDDPTQPLRQGYLVGNPAGLGVGDPFPETTAELPDGGSWSFEQDALGSVTLVAYWATYCPVCAHELPDMESAFWLPYADQGLQIVALDADDNEAANPQEVWDYIAYMNLSFPMGIDTGPTYSTLEAVYDGGNPFPVDILIDKAGVIRYVAREYDPEAIAELIPELLAE